MSKDKYASNCVERVLQHADATTMETLTSHVFADDTIEMMMADDYAK
jgi:hypothetical protein